MAWCCEVKGAGICRTAGVQVCDVGVSGGSRTSGAVWSGHQITQGLENIQRAAAPEAVHVHEVWAVTAQSAHHCRAALLKQPVLRSLECAAMLHH